MMAGWKSWNGMGKSALASADNNKTLA